jgi:hypothetical protein
MRKQLEKQVFKVIGALVVYGFALYGVAVWSRKRMATP